MSFPNTDDASNYDANQRPHVPLLDSADVEAPAADLPRQRRRRRRTAAVVILLLTGLLGVVYLVVTMTSNGEEELLPAGSPESSTTLQPEKMKPVARGVEEGVSEKTYRPSLGARAYPWTKRLLAWQRTAYHFQPKENWMNGPLFYKGWYHLFYQYNPDGAIWGNNIVWGHSASKDLIHWHHLPIAMHSDHWYDINGVWTGSATFLQDGQLIMLYTGSTNDSVQVQNLAYPADPSDPLLIHWVKYSGNPVLFPPPNISPQDFRDPTTAWLTPEGMWRITIGSKINGSTTGMSLVYDTKDFKSFKLLNGSLHSVPGTGMWECVDFYPVSKNGKNGLDTSEYGPGVKNIMKTSLDDDRNDYYAIGSYDSEAGIWSPDNPDIDVGIGLRYDYGIFYASKSFYDQEKKRRVLWGWVKETDSEETDTQKGWASLQAIPRTILLDKKTGSNILQWPVEEVEALRRNKNVFDHVKANPGSIVLLDVGSTSQLDIVAEFEINEEALKKINGTNISYSCTTIGGAAERGPFGPFGLLVLANKDLEEQTAIYFYISKDLQGNFKTFFCADHSRSSEATDVDKAIYGSIVPVLEGEKLSMRILVDHSIVESFAQGGRTCITSRLYPTKAVNEDAQIFLFNNATDASINASLQIWEMSAACQRRRQKIVNKD
ncbi:Beta-fructofuranosidase (invertase) [Handroanthus impetiginosus]|uniref:beta-fructofuranosidase n=1 Tax=Handroanthus impetiginosus TaxID=429701 RepID=A0A2G9GGS0_9LAMI|nr:Beta-fructofuranosidase (invertase) [Handroanthus impetiginosus]